MTGHILYMSAAFQQIRIIGQKIIIKKEKKNDIRKCILVLGIGTHEGEVVNNKISNIKNKTKN